MSLIRLVTKLFKAISKVAKIEADAVTQAGSELLEVASWPLKRRLCEYRIGNLCTHEDNKMKEDTIMVPCEKNACPI